MENVIIYGACSLRFYILPLTWLCLTYINNVFRYSCNQILVIQLIYYVKYLIGLFVISKIVLLNTKKLLLTFYLLLNFDDLYYQSYKKLFALLSKILSKRTFHSSEFTVFTSQFALHYKNE